MVAGLVRTFALSIGFIIVTGIPSDPAAAGDAAPPAGALRAYVDPETGELTVPPPSDGGAGDDSGASDPSGDLEIVPAPTDAGGVMVDLRGHFVHAVRANAVAEGTVSHECVSTEAPVGEK